MKSNNVIEKIKDVLNLTEEVKLEQMKLENGTILEADAFENGKEVFIVTEDEKVAMPVGEYELEDSRILKIEEEGLIAELYDAKDEEIEDEKEKEIEDEELAEEADVADWKGMEKRIKNLEDAIADLKAKTDKEEMSAEDIGNLLTEELAKHEKIELSEVPAEVQAELDKPAAEPIVSNPETKENLSKFKIGAKRPMSTMDRIISQLNK